jgi:hypothetical protein
MNAPLPPVFNPSNANLLNVNVTELYGNHHAH